MEINFPIDHDEKRCSSTTSWNFSVKQSQLEISLCPLSIDMLIFVVFSQS